MTPSKKPKALSALLAPALAALIVLLAACAPRADERAPDVGSQVNSTAQAQPTQLPDTAPDACPVTRSTSGFAPPGFTAEYPYEGEGWYGSAALWTAVPRDGRWHSLPYDAAHGYTQKVVFWAEGYDWQQEPLPELILRGRRLDGDAPDLITDHATNGFHPDLGSFILTGVEIPTAGCWEFEAAYGDAALRFVVWVAP